jgi:1-acyl-sn-glycerol-3-phosphate acyltransferase
MNILFILFIFYFLFYNYSEIFFQFLLKIIGFNVNIDIKNLPSKVIFISSHTSIYDFFIGMIIYYGYLHKKYKLYCLMKKLFESMVSPFLLLIDNKVNIISVDKTKNGLTTKIIDTLKTKDNYLIFIAPEGTRKINQTLRKGYWIIAKELNIDVVYVGIDFHKKYIQLEKNRKVDENWNVEQDNFIQEAIKYTPLYPEKFYWTKNYYDAELVDK